MTLIRRGSAKQLHVKRTEWLRAHPDKWYDVPGIHDDVTDVAREQLDRLCQEMKDAGIMGRGIHGPQQRDAIRRLISELRGQRVGEGWH